MSRNEIDEVLTKYGIYAGKEVTLFDYGEEIHSLIRFFKSGKPVSFERPDGYIKDGKKVLIIEHFAIDGYSELPNGGSELLRNENQREKEFSKLPATKEGIHLSKHLGTSNSYISFLENCKRRFEQHYSQIEAYKKHLIGEGLADTDAEFTTCFLMDDISPFGTLINYGDSICPVFLAKSKEFLDFYSNHPNVDWIISAVVLPSGFAPYFFSYKEINTYRTQTIDYSSYQFLSFDPVQMDSKIIVPKERLDGVS